MSTNPCRPDNTSAVNDLLDTLCHPIRREVIYYFERNTASDEATLSDLIAHLNEQMPSERDEGLRIKLTHTHLPKLADRGWLEYDTSEDRVVYDGHDTAKQLLGELQAVF